MKSLQRTRGARNQRPACDDLDARPRWLSCYDTQRRLMQNMNRKGFAYARDSDDAIDSAKMARDAPIAQLSAVAMMFKHGLERRTRYFREDIQRTGRLQGPGVFVDFPGRPFPNRMASATAPKTRPSVTPPMLARASNGLGDLPGMKFCRISNAMLAAATLLQTRMRCLQDR